MSEQSKSNKRKLLVHVQVLDANHKDIKRIQEVLKQTKQNIDKDIEFIITDQQISLNSVDYLIDMLKKLKYSDVSKDE